MSKEGGGAKRFVLLGTDYVYPRTTNKILRAFLHSKGVKDTDIDEVYTPFGHSDYQTIVANIKKFAAGGKTAVISTINGDSNVPFYKELGNAGLKATDVPGSIIRPSPNGLRFTATVILTFASITSPSALAAGKTIAQPDGGLRRFRRAHDRQFHGRHAGQNPAFPVVAGGVAIMYNLPGNPKLKLDGDTLANIYLGNINKWNDPKIAALNPGVDLPDLAIVPVYRTEGSGTTFIFTDYLSGVNPAWADSVGKSTSVKWPAGIGLGAKGSEGVAGQVKQISGAIGYGELAYADQSKIPYADHEKFVGQFHFARARFRQRRARHGENPGRLPVLDGQPARRGCLSHRRRKLGSRLSNQKNPDHGRKLVEFLKWAVTDGQKISSTLDYAPLPENVQQRELKLLDTIKY